jgi:hypothetical protein
MAAMAGLVFGHAWTLQAAAWWWVGAATLSSGMLLILSGMFARGALPRGPAPFLGDMLVFKGWVTDGQLADALVRQHHTGRPLGRILVEMKLISPSQLAQALEEQLEYRDAPVSSPTAPEEGQGS